MNMKLEMHGAITIELRFKDAIVVSDDREEKREIVRFSIQELRDVRGKDADELVENFGNALHRAIIDQLESRQKRVEESTADLQYVSENLGEAIRVMKLEAEAAG